MELPAQIGLCTELVTLGLSGNQLKMLPDSVADLWQLSLLLLDRNPLWTVPAALVGLRKLRTVSMVACPLEGVPAHARRSWLALIMFLNGSPEETEQVQESVI